ncbi:hypothetical protein HY491_04860 [Candidatus Woesearchaeota archaeon]|nr:hypothetical protein [Candidatus Woesearchaeota archaeon]
MIWVVLCILVSSFIPADAAFCMNDVRIPEEGEAALPLHQLAESFGKKPLSSTTYIYANG